MNEQATNEHDQPTCPCGVCAWADGEWWHWGGDAIVVEWEFCPFCGAPLNPDGTSGPSAEERAERLRQIYCEYRLWDGYTRDNTWQKEISAFATQDLLPRIADELGMTLEEDDDDDTR